MAINDPNSLQPVDNRRVVPQPGTTDATSAAEKPTAIFVNMTAAQADEYGLTDEYKKANTDGEDGITQEEYDYYQAHKNDPPEASEEAEETETDTTSGTDATEKNYNLFDGSKTVTSSTGASSSVWTGSADTARTATNPVVLTNPSIAASVSTDVYSLYTQSQAKTDATTATSDDTETDSTETTQGDTTTSTETSQSKSKSTAELTRTEFLDVNCLHPNITKDEIMAIENDWTRDQLLHKFNQFDSDHDNKISEDEYKAYALFICNEDSVRAEVLIATEKRIAAYMDANGCTRIEAINAINKQRTSEALSQKEGILDNLKFDKSKIDLSTTEALSQGELDNLSKNMKSIEGVRVGMTRAQAQQLDKTNPGILEKFDAISQGKEKIELIDIIKYALGAEASDDEIKARIYKTLTSHDSATRLQMEKQVFTAMYGEVDIANMDYIELADTFGDTMGEIFWNIENNGNIPYSERIMSALDCHADKETQEEYRTALQNGDTATITRTLGIALRQQLENDTDVRGELYIRMSSIRNGNDKYVQSLGIDPSKLSPEELEQYAIESATNTYILGIQQMLETMAKDISNEQDPEKKKAKNEELSTIIGSLKTAFEDIPQIRQLLETITIESVQDEQAKQDLVAAATTRGDFKLNEGNKDSLLSVATGALVISEGSEETVSEYLHQNAEYIEDIQFIAKDVVSSMPESPKKDSFAEFINNTIEEIIIQNNSGSSSYDNHSTTSGNGSGQGSSSAVQQTMYSLLQWNAQQNNAPKFSLDNLAPQNPIFQDDNGVTDVTEASGSRADQSSINQAAFRFKTEMGIPDKLRYAQARVQNMSKSKMFELVAKNFDRIPDQYKDQVINYFKQMPTQLLVETAIGNDEVKDFMFEHKFIKMDDIVNYVRKHPQLMEKGNKQISDSLKEQLKDFAKEQKLDDIHV